MSMCVVCVWVVVSVFGCACAEICLVNTYSDQGGSELQIPLNLHCTCSALQTRLTENCNRQNSRVSLEYVVLFEAALKAALSTLLQ